MREYLSLKECCPETSDVAATFHPTIGHCALQSLRNTTTPDLGMISPRNKEHYHTSPIAKGTIKFSKSNTVGFIRLTHEVDYT